MNPSVMLQRLPKASVDKIKQHIFISQLYLIWDSLPSQPLKPDLCVCVCANIKCRSPQCEDCKMCSGKPLLMASHSLKMKLYVTDCVCFAHFQPRLRHHILIGSNRTAVRHPARKERLIAAVVSPAHKAQL